MASIFNALNKGLIVSCQAFPGEPFYGPEFMVAMARSALIGGAAGLRINGPVDINAVRKVVNVPVIGLYKHDLAGYDVRITPTLEHARNISQAGADIIALDATERPHPDQKSVAQLIDDVHIATGKPVLADISTMDEALYAADAGADAVSTTLSGYTTYSPQGEEPDFDLIEALAGRLKIPLFAEGRIITPAQARQALDSGAFAVVVGTAITRPWLITAAFVKSMKR
jgi:N-acylglucosamine-6-phosphate 2-epimerase